MVVPENDRLRTKRRGISMQLNVGIRQKDQLFGIGYNMLRRVNATA